MRLSLRKIVGKAMIALFAFASSALVGCGHSSAGSSTAGPPPSGPALPVSPVGHEGRWLTDALGRVLLVHGVNMVNKDPPYTPAAAGFSDADAAWLADNGFRVVRVGALATGLMPTPGVVDQTYVDSIAATVADLAKHDVYSLVDFHQDGWGPQVGSDGFPGWMTLTGDAGNDTEAGFPFYYEDNPALQQAFQTFWEDGIGPGDAGLQEDYAAMFGALAKALAGQPYVLGYDLFNEPWPGKTWSPCRTTPRAVRRSTGASSAPRTRKRSRRSAPPATGTSSSASRSTCSTSVSRRRASPFPAATPAPAWRSTPTRSRRA
jgi:endoglycosylceramidase